MSHGDKLAWAGRNGVKPPAFVIAAAAREIIAEKVAAKSEKPVCSHCCRAKPASETCRDDNASSESSPVPRGVGFVMLHEAMKCRGLTVSVSLLPPSLPAQGSEFEPFAQDDLLPVPGPSHLYDGPYLAVDSPPPDAPCS